ncbi:hypothetical protein ACROYT_G014570 [Oculina patagonica]
MTTFDFNAWCTTTQLKEATVEALKKEDIDSEAALKLLTEKDVEELGLSVGQKRVLEAALKKLKLEEQAKTEPGDVTDPVTTKSLAKDSGLEEILKKIEGAGSLEDSLLALGTTDLFPGKTPAAQNSSTLNSTLPRLDNDPHVFLGQQQQKAIGTKQGEKPLLIPDFINLGTYDSSEEEQEIGNNSSGAKIIFRATKAKPKLEQITLSMWVASNSRIMYELLKKGKLSATTSDIADYLAYTAWIRNLGNDPDRNFIIDGLTNGFEIIPSETVLEKAETSNYKSATAGQFRYKVEKQIREEISKGNYVVTQAKPTIVSALGAIPKPQSDKIRLIHDCSRPQHSNVNSYATTQHFSYVTVEQAVSMIKPNAYLAKIDLKSAYRHVPIHPSNYSATGLAWQFHGENHITYLYDSKLPFGASKSPEIFHRLTQAVTRMMAKRGFHTILAYLDDFLIIGDSKYECELAYQELIQLLSELVLVSTGRKQFLLPSD